MVIPSTNLGTQLARIRDWTIASTTIGSTRRASSHEASADDPTILPVPQAARQSGAIDIISLAPNGFCNITYSIVGRSRD
jgi:hypothetical protein